MAKVTAAITAVGKYVPDYILTNKEFYPKLGWLNLEYFIIM